MFQTPRAHLTLLLSVFFITFSSASLAQINYFSADVPVMSQSRNDQQKAAKLGLLEVLVRISGTEQPKSNSIVASRANNALSFVTEFQYADVTQEELRLEGFRHMLKLSYSERLVRNLLADAGLPIWSVNRPKTLVWLVEDSLEFGKRMVPYDLENEVIEGIEKAALYRGLPLAFPLLDFEDQSTLGAERLWELDEIAILEASERYRADVIFVGKYSSTSSGTLLSSWQFFHADKTKIYDVRSDLATQIGYDAVVPLADFLASLYSFGSMESEYFSLSVFDVENFADYRGLISTLESFDTISEVKIDQVAHDQISLRFRSEASLNQVTKQFALARTLFPIQSEQASALPEWERQALGSPQNPLTYRWQR